MSARPLKFINDPADLVGEMLEGWVMTSPGVITLTADGHIARTHPKAEGKVALVIGNGSGHEPAMVGFVGPGLMDLNVPGPIFAAPSAAAIAKGIVAADRGAGVLLCVSNHAGDVLAAELAVEGLAERAGTPEVRMAVLGEDIGTPVEQRAERRGGAGLLFVWKMLGAYAEQGHSLDECLQLARRVASRSASISATAAAGSHPVSGALLASIPERHVLIGSGVHGEGTEAVPFATVDDLVAEMVDRLMTDPVIAAASRVALIVNNAGSLTGMELGIIARSCLLELGRRSVAVERRWFGTYATTQEAAGFVVALCELDDNLRELYDAPASGASWSTGATP